MKGKQVLYLFVALLLPTGIFLFLKIFGKNEFEVKPLYQDAAGPVQAGCYPVQVPYHLPDSIFSQVWNAKDSLVLVTFSELKGESLTQLERVRKDFQQDALAELPASRIGKDLGFLKKCIFLTPEPFDLVLVDKHGRLRGQYLSSDREEVDRLITEIAIILKKY